MGLFARWLHHARHREPRTEPVSPRTGVISDPRPDWIVTRVRPTGLEPTALDKLAVHLPPVRHADPGHGPAVDVREPTIHIGATEDWSPLGEIGPDTGASLDPDEAAWDVEWAELDRRLADNHMAFVRRWVATVEPLAEHVAPGWRDLPAHPADSFTEVLEMAGVFVMPAEAVDWSTAEYAVVC